MKCLLHEIDRQSVDSGHSYVFAVTSLFFQFVIAILSLLISVCSTVDAADPTLYNNDYTATPTAPAGASSQALPNHSGLFLLKEEDRPQFLQNHYMIVWTMEARHKYNLLPEAFCLIEDLRNPAGYDELLQRASQIKKVDAGGHVLERVYLSPETDESEIVITQFDKSWQVLDYKVTNLMGKHVATLTPIKRILVNNRTIEINQRRLPNGSYVRTDGIVVRSMIADEIGRTYVEFTSEVIDQKGTVISGTAIVGFREPGQPRRAFSFTAGYDIDFNKEIFLRGR